jgi:hypothetical protein
VNPDDRLLFWIVFLAVLVLCLSVATLPRVL